MTVLHRPPGQPGYPAGQNPRSSDLVILALWVLLVLGGIAASLWALASSLT
jgi:hypothetical protein